METPFDSKYPKSVEKALNLYKGCNDYEKRDEVGYEPLKEILKLMKGWPIAQKDWDEKDFNWEEAFITLFRNNANGYLFSLSVRSDPKQTNKYILHVTN